jgi:hypothetical protein
MKIQNVVVKKTYTNKAGEEKVTWLNVGSIRTTDDGKQYIELNMFPETSFYVFDRKEKDEITL